MLKNYMEIVVDDTLKEMLKTKDLKCDCDRCILDIKAMTLNNLKPTYIVSDKGILYTKLNEFNSQFRTDVIRELMKAIEVVEENPNH